MEFKKNELVYFLAEHYPVVATITNNNKFIDHIDIGECIEVQYSYPEIISTIRRTTIMKSEAAEYIFKDKDSLLKALVKKHDNKLKLERLIIADLRELD